MATVYGTTPDKSVFPRTISGLTLWLDGNDTSTLFDSDTGGNQVIGDGTAVGRWQDKSGNNYHATQSSASLRAVFKRSIRNNKNIIRFDGTDDFYTGISNAIGTLTANSKFTFFIACIPDLTGRQPSFGGGGIIGKRQFGDSRDWYFGVRSSGKFAFNNNAGSNACKVSNSTLVTNTAYIIGASLDYNTSSIPTIYLGATAETTTNDDGSGGWGIGDGEIGRGYTVSSYYFKGDLCEIIIYNSVLSISNRQKIVNYLNNKWKTA